MFKRFFYTFSLIVLLLGNSIMFTSCSSSSDDDTIPPVVCTTTPITPNIKVNNDAWVQTSSATVDEGSTVILSPETGENGYWGWTGPNGFTSTTREITFSDIETSSRGTYVVTFKDLDFCENKQTFSINVDEVNLPINGFTIQNNELVDANGNNFVMKGFNVPTAWFANDMNNNIANIRNNTGANCLRIVVTTSTSDAVWQESVNKCIANNMIPMIELHDVTGSNSPEELNNMAEFWASKAAFLTSPEISKYILINIANEWSDWFMSATATGTVSRQTWRDAYITAVATIRDAGIKTTLVIDAAGYGQDNQTQTILEYAQSVQASDMYNNCLFSVHMYCEWKVGGNSTITTHLPAIKNAGIPIIVGEFGFQHTEGSDTCDVDENEIISTANANGIGWLAWSWKGNGGGVEYLDMSNDWAGTDLTDWGETVVNGTGGTQTAVTASVFD